MYLDKQLFALLAIIICASASHFLEQEWNAWKSKHEKKYVTVDDELFRRKVWEETWNRVQKHNELYAQGGTKYKKAMNQFSDMTIQERNSKSCISKKDNLPTQEHVPVRVYENNQNIPDSVDWRDSKCVSEVRNQGSFCGSCWAFATVGVVETHYCLKKKELVALSEQQLVDCDPINEGCCGGLPTKAFQYVSHRGIMKATDYEYSQKKFTCEYKPDDAIIFNVTKYYALPDEDTMASSVALDGPITVGIDASSDFQEYGNGVFTGGCTDQPNHAVIIVGYGKEHDEKEDKDVNYWIIRNSWGKEWGDNGYAKMLRDENLCGITTMPSSLDLVH